MKIRLYFFIILAALLRHSRLLSKDSFAISRVYPLDEYGVIFALWASMLRILSIVSFIVASIFMGTFRRCGYGTLWTTIPKIQACPKGAVVERLYDNGFSRIYDT